MEVIKPYKRGCGYSYALGAFPTFELLRKRPECAIGVFVHSTFPEREKVESMCAEHGIQIPPEYFLEVLYHDAEGCAVATEKLLLLDEHTAALDPATAAKVLELSDKIVADNNLTTLMITHNMGDAIRHGNRLIMMDKGHIILDVRGEEKSHLTRQDLMDKFAELSGTQVESDEMLLS